MPSTNNTPFLAILFLFLGLLWFDSFPGLEAANGTLASIPGLYVFGDSLVDAGNNNHLLISIARANYPRNGVDFPSKTPTGRFCNGKNAADILAEKFNLPLAPPYLSLRDLVTRKKRKPAPVTGVNFASGGAGIFNSSDQKNKQAIPLSQQVNDWISIQEELNVLGISEAQIHVSKSLFAVVIGSNDLFDYVGSSKLQQKTTPEQYTVSMAVKLKEQMKRVYDTGARRFLVLGVAEIGCAPGRRKRKSMFHPCNEEANNLASLYNEALTKMLQQLKEELGSSMTYSYFDIFKSIHDIISNPSRYGFDDVKSACCGTGRLNAEFACLPLAKLCPDRTKYLFWDLFGHPTEAAARTVVDLMLTENPQYSSPLTLTQLVSS